MKCQLNNELAENFEFPSFYADIAHYRVICEYQDLTEPAWRS